MYNLLSFDQIEMIRWLWIRFSLTMRSINVSLRSAPVEWQMHILICEIYKGDRLLIYKQMKYMKSHLWALLHTEASILSLTKMKYVHIFLLLLVIFSWWCGTERKAVSRKKSCSLIADDREHDTEPYELWTWCLIIECKEVRKK